MNDHTVLISKKVKRISLQRYLLSKIAYGDKIGFREIGGLFLNQLWLEQKATSDKQFNQKFKKILEISSSILRQLNVSRGLSDSTIANLRKNIIHQLENFLVPRRNYAQWKMKFDSSVLLKSPKPSGVLTKTLPAERYIGIGYRDKGTAKKPEIDGSPSWQEVAQSNQALDSRMKEIQYELQNETNNIKQKLELQKEWSRLKNEQRGRTTF